MIQNNVHDRLLFKHCFDCNDDDPIYGARPLRRSITKFLEDKLAEECLSFTLHEGTQINVTQQIQPNVYGNKPVYLPKFDDIYTREIIIDFDYSKVDFTLLKGPEKKEEKRPVVDRRTLKEKIADANKNIKEK